MTGHEYYIACKLTLVASDLEQTKRTFGLKGIRFVTANDFPLRQTNHLVLRNARGDSPREPKFACDVNEYAVLMLAEWSGPHPDLGEVFACDAEFVHIMYDS